MFTHWDLAKAYFQCVYLPHAAEGCLVCTDHLSFLFPCLETGGTESGWMTQTLPSHGSPCPIGILSQKQQSGWGGLAGRWAAWQDLTSHKIPKHQTKKKNRLKSIKSFNTKSLWQTVLLTVSILGWGFHARDITPKIYIWGPSMCNSTSTPASLPSCCHQLWLLQSCQSLIVVS